MPLPEKRYTSDDYWNLPDGERAELINGQLYMIAPPSRLHQELVHQLSRVIGNYISDKRGDCKIYPAPFAVNLNADDTVYAGLQYQKWQICRGRCPRILDCRP